MLIKICLNDIKDDKSGSIQLTKQISQQARFEPNYLKGFTPNQQQIAKAKNKEGSTKSTFSRISPSTKKPPRRGKQKIQQTSVEF